MSVSLTFFTCMLTHNGEWKKVLFSHIELKVIYQISVRVDNGIFNAARKKMYKAERLYVCAHYSDFHFWGRRLWHFGLNERVYSISVFLVYNGILLWLLFPINDESFQLWTYKHTSCWKVSAKWNKTKFMYDILMSLMRKRVMIIVCEKKQRLLQRERLNEIDLSRNHRYYCSGRELSCLAESDWMASEKNWNWIWRFFFCCMYDCGYWVFCIQLNSSEVRAVSGSRFNFKWKLKK